MSRATVVCLGNDLVGDDGAGGAVYELLLSQGLEDACLLRVGVGGVALLDLLDGAECLVVVDATRLGGAPGTLRVLAEPQLPRLCGAPVSAHGVALPEVLALGRALFPERMPRTLTLVGIEGECFNELGVGLSPAVGAVIGRAADAVRRLVSVEIHQGQDAHVTTQEF